MTNRIERLREAGFGVVIRSVHDETEFRWTVELLSLEKRRHSRMAFYGVSLEDALKQAEVRM